MPKLICLHMYVKDPAGSWTRKTLETYINIDQIVMVSESPSEYTGTSVVLSSGTTFLVRESVAAVLLKMMTAGKEVETDNEEAE